MLSLLAWMLARNRLAVTVVARQLAQDASGKRTDTSVPRTVRVTLFVGVSAILAACTDEGARLSVEEGLKCAIEGFKNHSGTFGQRGDSIAYSYESENGPAKVIVTFDKRRRPVSTFFASAPHGSHEELMEAAQAIKNCVAYGPKARGERDESGETSMIGR